MFSTNCKGVLRMNNKLYGSADDGKKIMDNFNQFSYRFSSKSKEDNHLVFNVSFFEQDGTLNFFIDENGNVRDTTLDLNGFPKPLGAHNDPTLNVLGEEIKNNYMNSKS